MTDALFTLVHGWLSGAFWIAAAGAFLWGMVSVLFSPCHLAATVLLVGYMAGQGGLATGAVALRCSLAFVGGLFATIVAVGLLCVALGRMLGDLGAVLPVAVGVALCLAGLEMAGLTPLRRRSPGAGAGPPRFRGAPGALLLGLTYGGATGACTFGFLAPLLAVVALEGRVAAGMALLALFALGHCLPLLLAGVFAGQAGRWLARRGVRDSAVWLRRGGGVLVLGMGAYVLTSTLGRG